MDHTRGSDMVRGEFVLLTISWILSDLFISFLSDPNVLKHSFSMEATAPPRGKHVFLAGLGKHLTLVYKAQIHVHT